MVSKTSVPVVVALLAVFALGACTDDSTSSAGTGASPSSSAPSPLPLPSNVTTTRSKAKVKPAPLDTSKPSVAISKAPPVAAGTPATLTEGIRVTVGPISSITVTANGPGEIAGKAVKVPIQVQNTSGKPFSLDGFSLTATYGKGIPASTNSSGPADALAGNLKPGSSAQGVYLFSTPHSSASTFEVEVSSSSAATILVFRR